MFNWLYAIGEDIGSYSSGMYRHLCGWDVTCSGFFGTPYGNYLGGTMLGITALTLILFYVVIDHPTMRKTLSWWLMALIMFVANFIAAYLIIRSSLHPGGACKDLRLNNGDVLGLAFFNAGVGFIIAFFLSLSSFPRKLISNNNSFTTFYPISKA